ncbi:MAG TPA: sulfite exporter TauE/SafE family protein [Thermoanaerobaculia bacterium]|nr:sulfite exporter TauE/SafE family protein [Thermoanaerobaculia bacterium]HUM29254.1 sulfite exporter TauE/SafE family protein [Thermoanaerobaculia bacterium]HXK67788.1 sulfite exporter TauE/SafE family protein [Thermoanaerobaculia bacterium]
MFALFILFGVLIGVLASFSGLGGGFLMVPLLLFLGKPHTHAVGTSFLAILLISLSALLAHNKLANVDYTVGLCLAAGGIIGAQVGARLVPMVSQSTFQRIFAVFLLFMAIYLFIRSR